MRVSQGRVTIATNMAGRGTDIKLTPESVQPGDYIFLVPSVMKVVVSIISCVDVLVVKEIRANPAFIFLLKMI